MKVLMYGETPCIETGTGQLSRHLTKFLLDFSYELELVGINHFVNVPHDLIRYPFRIHTCPSEEAFNYEKTEELIRRGDFDLLFISCDISGINRLARTIREERSKRNFYVLAYTCIDCSVVSSRMLAGLTVCDQIVMYSQHSARIAAKYDIQSSVIMLGCEPEVFYQIDKKLRSENRQSIFGIDDETFLFINVNRNQWRKDLGRTLMIFHEFHRKHPHSMLYLHSKVRDFGGCLTDMAEFLSMRLVLPYPEVVFAGQRYNECSGYKREFLNLLYNCADALISTTTGEGFGLSTTEAMAAGTPVIIPGNTSAFDIVGEYEERGYLAKAGGDLDHTFIPYGSSDNPRDLVHSASMIEKMELVYSRRGREKINAARKWTEQNTWDHVRLKWKSLLNNIEGELKNALSKWT